MPRCSNMREGIRRAELYCPSPVQNIPNVLSEFYEGLHSLRLICESAHQTYRIYQWEMWHYVNRNVERNKLQLWANWRRICGFAKIHPTPGRQPLNLLQHAMRPTLNDVRLALRKK